MAQLTSEQIKQYQQAAAGMSPQDIAKAASGLGLDSSNIDQIFGSGTAQNYGYNASTGALSNPNFSTAPSSPQAQNLSQAQRTADASATPAQTQNLAYAQTQYQAPTPTPTPAPTSSFNPNNTKSYLADFATGKTVADVAKMAKDKGLTSADLGQIYGVSADDINKLYGYDKYLAGGSLKNSDLAYNYNTGKVNIGSAIWPKWVDANSPEAKAFNGTFTKATEGNQGTYNYDSPIYKADTSMSGAKGTFTPYTMAPDPNSLTQNQLNNVLKKNGPLMQTATNTGILQAGQRGLGDSSLAAGYAQDAMIKAATPIAQSDAAVFATKDKGNQDLYNSTQNMITDYANKNVLQDKAAQNDLNTLKANQSFTDYSRQEDYVNSLGLADRQSINAIKQIDAQAANNLVTTKMQIDADQKKSELDYKARLEGYASSERTAKMQADTQLSSDTIKANSTRESAQIQAQSNLITTQLKVNADKETTAQKISSDESINRMKAQVDQSNIDKTYGSKVVDSYRATSESLYNNYSTRVTNIIANKDMPGATKTWEVNNARIEYVNAYNQATATYSGLVGMPVTPPATISAQPLLKNPEVAESDTLTIGTNGLFKTIIEPLQSTKL